jgi:hypothetical protein
MYILCSLVLIYQVLVVLPGVYQSNPIQSPIQSNPITNHQSNPIQSNPIQSLPGVYQSLVGLFIEQLHELISMQLPGAGPVIGDIRVLDIFYADDVKLLAVQDAAALQQLLDVLHLFMPPL